MSIQAMIDSAQRIEVDRRRLVGQTISRSQRIRTQERISSQPFRITVTPPAILNYDTNRSTIENIMTVDRNTEVDVRLGNNSRTRYITDYQGNLRDTQLTALTVTNFTGTTMSIEGLPSIGSSARTGLVSSTTVIFSVGDYVQPYWSRYPYLVTNTVLRGTGSTATVTVHRTRITSENTTITNAPLLVGTDTHLTVIVTQLPTYELAQYRRVNFTGDFELIERII